jgi:hypothetical protein
MQAISFNNFFEGKFTPNEVRDRGLSLFKDSNLITDRSNGYPGTRREVPFDIRKYIEEKISEPISILLGYEKIQIKPNARVGMEYHLTTSIHQHGLVHTDNPSWIAGVIYLNPVSPKNSGTKFLKLKKEYQGTTPGVVNFREVNVTDDEKLIKLFGTQKEYYNKRYFQEEKYIENVYNSAILYPGKYYHCPGKYFGETLEDSRFVIVIFANH